MTRAELLALADRVEAGESGQHIDVQVFRHITPGTASEFGFTDDTVIRYYEVPFYTVSIDVQRMLPAKVIVSMYEPETGMWEAQATTDPHDDSPLKYGCAPTEPAARLAAILRAMAEREPEA